MDNSTASTFFKPGQNLIRVSGSSESLAKHYFSIDQLDETMYTPMRSLASASVQSESNSLKSALNCEDGAFSLIFDCDGRNFEKACAKDLLNVNVDIPTCSGKTAKRRNSTPADRKIQNFKIII